MLHGGKHGPVTNSVRHIAAIKFKVIYFFFLEIVNFLSLSIDMFSIFCYDQSGVVCEIFKSFSVFIWNWGLNKRYS